MGLLSRPTVSTAALVLRAWPCGETSAVVSLLTRDHGYVKVIAKAARGPRSRLRPLIEPGRLVDVEFSLDPHRELQFLRGGEVDLDPLANGATLERSAFLLGALELVDRCRPQVTLGSPGEDLGASADLFEVCSRYVRMLSSRTCSRPDLLFFAFEWELLARHGIAPELSACVACGRERAELDGEVLRFHSPEGGIVCGPCALAARGSGGQALTPAALGHLLEMARTGIGLDGALAEGPALPRPTRRELGTLLHRFLGYHLPGYRLPAALDLLRAGKDSTA
jgi:DNA repair protein RecO (recombination protein O)